MAAVPSSPAGVKPGSFLQVVFDLLRELPGIVSDRVHLLTLELQRARGALGQMIVLGVAAALLALTAWFALWVGLALAAVAAGLAWGWILLLILALNIGGAWAAVARIRKLAVLLTLPATVRRLTVAPPAARPAPPATVAVEHGSGQPPPAATPSTSIRPAAHDKP